MGIKHRADSGFRKFSALSKIGFGRTELYFEMPYVSYPSRWRAFKMKKFLLIFLVGISMGFSVHGQNYPLFGKIEIFPENPSTIDSVELRTWMATPNHGWSIDLPN